MFNAELIALHNCAANILSSNYFCVCRDYHFHLNLRPDVEFTMPNNHATVRFLLGRCHTRRFSLTVSVNGRRRLLTITIQYSFIEAWQNAS